MYFKNETLRTKMFAVVFALVSSFGVLKLSVSADVEDCAAKCLFTEAFAFKAEVSPQNPNPQLLTYDVVEPAQTEFPHCFRIWITNGGGDNLVNSEIHQIWYKKRSDSSHICQPNSGIPAEGVVGESKWGPATPIICYKECLEIQEEELGKAKDSVTGKMWKRTVSRLPGGSGFEAFL